MSMNNVHEQGWNLVCIDYLRPVCAKVQKQAEHAVRIRGADPVTAAKHADCPLFRTGKRYGKDPGHQAEAPGKAGSEALTY